MNRRTFILTTVAAAALMPVTSFAAPLTYSEGMVTKLLGQGKTVFLDFKASWCSTCAAQERVISSLLKTNPAYEKAVTFINVDWDQHGDGALSKALNIPRRSTLVALKGKKEIGRIVAGTGKADIKALMDAALAAANA